MTQTEQSKEFKHIRAVVNKLRSEKPKQYQSTDNVFLTYESIARKQGVYSELVLRILNGKHEVSIQLIEASLKQGEIIPIEKLDEKFGDLLNYLEQYYTMLVDRNNQNKKNASKTIK